MTRSELIERLAVRNREASDHERPLEIHDIERAVKSIVEQLTHALVSGERIEIRGFGSFALHYRPARAGRNPRTGALVQVPEKFVPHFKAGKELRDRVNQSGSEGA